MKDCLAGLERYAATCSHAHCRNTPIARGVAADKIGRHIGDRTVGLEVVGLADILPGARAADGRECVWAYSVRR